MLYVKYFKLITLIKHGSRTHLTLCYISSQWQFKDDQQEKHNVKIIMILVHVMCDVTDNDYFHPSDQFHRIEHSKTSIKRNNFPKKKN